MFAEAVKSRGQITGVLYFDYSYAYRQTAFIVGGWVGGGGLRQAFRRACGTAPAASKFKCLKFCSAPMSHIDIQGCSSSVLLYVHRKHKAYSGRLAQDGHLVFHTAPEL